MMYRLTSNIFFATEQHARAMLAALMSAKPQMATPAQHEQAAEQSWVAIELCSHDDPVHTPCIPLASDYYPGDAPWPTSPLFQPSI